MLQGREHLDEALGRGKGCVLWVAHFVFAPNIAKLALHDAGYKVSHLSRLDHGFSSTRFGIKWLNPVRSRFEDRLLAEPAGIDGNDYGRLVPLAKALREHECPRGETVVYRALLKC